MSLELLKQISIQSESKIVLLVIDGLGGLPDSETGRTELETAKTPNLDALASKGICGLSTPVAPGITPGSGPGHLAIFGYDPIKFNLGRGILEAAGIDFNLKEQDVAARGNFATIDDEGNVSDRRAGRISTRENEELCRQLDGQQTDDGTTIIVRPIKEHRFLVVFRGQGLSSDVTDTDPQQTGVPAREASPLNNEAGKTARIVNRFVAEARKILSHQQANMILLRGFSRYPQLPSMEEIYKLKPAAIAIYPMYRGLAKLVGMEVLEAGTKVGDEFRRAGREYRRFDFLFLHVKHADSQGEDGNFDRKVEVIEEVDRLLPIITGLEPDVFMVTGDHSTPAVLRGHSWHPVPFFLTSKWCRPDKVNEFSESACLYGGLGRFQALDIMPLAMANALKLRKFGA